LDVRSFLMGCLTQLEAHYHKLFTEGDRPPKTYCQAEGNC